MKSFADPHFINYLSSRNTPYICSSEIVKLAVMVNPGFGQVFHIILKVLGLGWNF